MLILARREGESVQIGDEIVVTVLMIEGNQVKISFDAPRDVRIMRSELLDKAQTLAPLAPPGPVVVEVKPRRRAVPKS